MKGNYPGLQDKKGTHRRAEKEADRLYLMVEVEQKQAFIQGVRFAIALAEKEGMMGGGMSITDDELLAIADHDEHEMTVLRVQGPPSLVLRCVACDEDVHIWSGEGRS